MGKKVVTFGEIMLRLATPGYSRFIQAERYEASYAGGEANVAASLANYGMNACFVTKLPSNDIGQACRGFLRKYGVNTEYIRMDGERLGTYYLETGASQRPSKVIYDRADSAVAKIIPGDIDWEAVFDGAELFHFTGITPAISDTAAEVTLEALKVAKRKGITVSCDFNYRKKLWSREKAKKVMSELMAYVDIGIGNEEDAEMVFGIQGAHTDVTAGQLDIDGYQQVAEELINRFDFKKSCHYVKGKLFGLGQWMVSTAL